MSDWNFYIAKLNQHGDANKIPVVCALGSYLFVTGGTYDPARNIQAVNTLRANALIPDGFNFYAYAALYTNGQSPDPPDKLAAHHRSLRIP